MFWRVELLNDSVTAGNGVWNVILDEQCELLDAVCIHSDENN